MTAPQTQTPPAEAPPTPQTAWVSGAGTVHLTLDCVGLELMKSRSLDPEEYFTQVAYTQLATLQAKLPADNTLCRLCALEPVATAILGCEDASPTVFTMFTIARPDAARKHRSARSIDPERRAKLAEEAAARMARIAAVAGLTVTRTTRGPAAYGFLGRVTANRLAGVVLTEQRFGVDTLPDAVLVTTFWAMHAAAARGELAVDPSTGQPSDPWYLAEMICCDLD